MPSLLLAVADSDERTFLADQLTADGYEIIEAASHGEAVLAAQTERSVGAVVVDLALPDRGALRIVRELRAGRHVDLPAEFPVLALLRKAAQRRHRRVGRRVPRTRASDRRY